MVHVLLKPGLENFKHYFASVWDECYFAVVWAFFGIAFLWDWTEHRPSPVLWPLLSFPNLLAYWVCSTLTAPSFRIWISSTGIPSPPLALSIVMLPKAHLTSHSRMSGCRWVITPLWLYGSWWYFLYTSYVSSCHLFWISSASVRSVPFLSFFCANLCLKCSLQFSSVQFSRLVMSDSLWLHELQHRPLCPSLTPGVHPNPCPSSRWYHPIISSSVIPFSSWPQSFPASRSFPMSQLFASGG